MESEPLLRRGRISRRAFLWGATASAGAVAIGGALAGIPGAIAGNPGGPPIRNPLYIPPTVTPSSYTLTAAPATVSLGGGRLASAWADNGPPPGSAPPAPPAD